MSQHPSDRFSATPTQNPATGSWEYLLRRLDKDDAQKTTDTFTLLPEEAILLFNHFMDEPKFQKIALEKLEALQLARPNHSIP